MQSNKKRYFQIMLLILAAGSIYPLIYLRTSFQQPILDVFGIDISQLSTLYSIIGLMFIVGYLPSGYLADKFSSKLLVSFSLIGTGVVGLYFGTIPKPEMLKYVFLLWGITSVFTFWSALMKAIKLLTLPNEQAKVFGFLDGGRGVVEALLATVAVLLFSFASKGGSDVEATTDGLVAVIYMYSIIMIVLGVLILFVLDNNKGEVSAEESDKDTRNVLTDLVTLMKIKEVWLMSLVIFTGYTLFWTTYYFSGYLSVNHGVSATTAASIATAMLWMRPIGGIGGGFLGDKFGRENILTLTFIGAIAGLVLLGIFTDSMILAVVAAVILFIGLMTYAIRGLYWSILDECNLPVYMLGLGIGFISFIGYLPDIIIPQISKVIYGNFEGAAANNVYFFTSAAIGAVGIIFILLFKRTVISRKNDVV